MAIDKGIRYKEIIYAILNILVYLSDLHERYLL